MIPQAYTARDIGEAYKWIQTLPPNVRDEMKTMEQMVLHYLRAKSMGNLANFQLEQQTKKSQDFQKTLQSLKVEMDQFDPPAPQPPPPTAVAPSVTVSAPAQTQETSLKLDSRSRQIVNEIKEGLNLSSDMEVIRMCL